METMNGVSCRCERRVGRRSAPRSTDSRPMSNHWLAEELIDIPTGPILTNFSRTT